MARIFYIGIIKSVQNLREICAKSLKIIITFAAK